MKPFGIGVATGEHCQNRVMFKQFLQASALQYCQIDSCRVGSVNELLSIILMAKKFDGESEVSFLFPTMPASILSTILASNPLLKNA